jgi:hypothetical protein
MRKNCEAKRKGGHADCAQAKCGALLAQPSVTNAADLYRQSRLIAHSGTTLHERDGDRRSAESKDLAT